MTDEQVVPQEEELPYQEFVPEELPQLDYDAVYPHKLDENQNIVWDAHVAEEIRQANIPVLAALARQDRNSKLDQYDKLVNGAVRDIRLAGPSADVSKLYAYIDRLDKYAIELQGLPDTWGFPENIRWPELPTLAQE